MMGTPRVVWLVGKKVALLVVSLAACLVGDSVEQRDAKQ